MWFVFPQLSGLGRSSTARFYGISSIDDNLTLGPVILPVGTGLRPAAAAGIATKLGNHSFRATRITAYLKKGGTLEKAVAMANHASTRTTQLYDRRRHEVSLDEVERIVI
jgi:integrase